MAVPLSFEAVDDTHPEADIPLPGIHSTGDDTLPEEIFTSETTTSSSDVDTLQERLKLVERRFAGNLLHRLQSGSIIPLIIHVLRRFHVLQETSS